MVGLLYDGGKQTFNKFDLISDIAFGDSLDLHFPNHVHRFKYAPADRQGGSMCDIQSGTVLFPYGVYYLRWRGE